MTSREIFQKALNLEPASRLPAAPHWWGVYKYEVCGLDPAVAAWQDGRNLVPVYEAFYEKFRPDWFHLHIGTPAYFKDSIVEKQTEEGRAYLRIDPSQRSCKKEDRYFSVMSGDDEEIIDFPDYLLHSRCFREKADITSKTAVDEYVKNYVSMSADEIITLGYADHVRLLSEKYGESVYIAVHIPSAICEIFDPHTGYLGFEAGLIALYEQPDEMKYLFQRCYEAQLEWAKAYARAGAHGYIISESYISPDIAGEDIWRTYMKGIHTEHFAEIGRYGIDPLCMFWGDVNPLVEEFRDINIKALLVEESKKTFRLDIREIHKRIGEQVCLFGNVDSITLLKHSSPSDVGEEAAEQMRGIDSGFICANGSPIAPGTPEANVQALIDAVKER